MNLNMILSIGAIMFLITSLSVNALLYNENGGLKEQNALLRSANSETEKTIDKTISGYENRINELLAALTLEREANNKARSLISDLEKNKAKIKQGDYKCAVTISDRGDPLLERLNK